MIPHSLGFGLNPWMDGQVRRCNHGTIHGYVHGCIHACPHGYIHRVLVSINRSLDRFRPWQSSSLSAWARAKAWTHIHGYVYGYMHGSIPGYLIGIIYRYIHGYILCRCMGGQDFFCRGQASNQWLLSIWVMLGVGLWPSWNIFFPISVQSFECRTDTDQGLSFWCFSLVIGGLLPF